MLLAQQVGMNKKERRVWRNCFRKLDSIQCIHCAQQPGYNAAKNINYILIHNACFLNTQLNDQGNKMYRESDCFYGIRYMVLLSCIIFFRFTIPNLPNTLQTKQKQANLNLSGNKNSTEQENFQKKQGFREFSVSSDLGKSRIHPPNPNTKKRAFIIQIMSP